MKASLRGGRNVSVRAVESEFDLMLATAIRFNGIVSGVAKHGPRLKTRQQLRVTLQYLAMDSAGILATHLGRKDVIGGWEPTTNKVILSTRISRRFLERAKAYTMELASGVDHAEWGGLI